MSDDLMTKVQDLIENMINPAVAGHGGFVQLVDVKDNKDPKGPQTGTVKLMRGGSWPDFASDLRVARRSGFPPNCRYSTTGSSTWRNAQPVYRDVGHHQFALGHNGNLTNTEALAEAAGL